jgi:hypothetical protein
MNTVMTPETVRRCYSEGKLKDLADPNFVGDEVFLFIYPSTDPINEYNGDGELLEIHDWAKDFSKVWTFSSQYETTPDTIIWWR